MAILTVNAGSSSVRLAAFTAAGEVLTSLGSERFEAGRTPRTLLPVFLERHRIASVSLVAHRVVHGGARFVAPELITPSVEAEIDRLSSLAPLHNPPALAWIRECRSVVGERTPQVAVFDTAFYARLPPVATHYALPPALCERHGIRRYGFHGLAHQAMFHRWRALRRDLREGGRLISLQLGAGCSITAVSQGEAQDTSMGFSPLEGLVMATRSGDVDPGLFAYLNRATGMGAAEFDTLLNTQSGLLGVSGVSGDMREVLDSAEPAARLAADLYCYRARKYVGAYMAVLGGADGIVFGGGVGENAPAVRAKILAGLAWCGVEIDLQANDDTRGAEARISTASSRVDVWVIPVEEAAVLARQGLRVATQRE